MRASPWVLAGLPLLLLACGSSSSGASGSSSGAQTVGPVSQANFAGTVMSDVCPLIGACCQQAGLTFAASECASQVGGPFAADGLGVDQLAALPGVTYDPDAAGRCIDAMRTYASNCDSGAADQQALAAACNAIFVGSLPLGATCTANAQCAGASAGTAYCDNVDDLVGNGDASSPAGGGNGPSNTCVARPASAGATDTGSLGAPCYGTSIETDGSVGEGTSGVSTGSAGSSGGASGPPANGVVCSVNAGFYCDTTSWTCAATLADGATCETGATWCAIESSCFASTCRPRAAAGGSCVSELDCQDGLRCSMTKQACFAPGVTGASCQVGFDCASGTCGPTGKCGPSAFNGELCQGGVGSGTPGSSVGAGGASTGSEPAAAGGTSPGNPVGGGG